MATETWVRPDGGTLKVDWDKAVKDEAAGAKGRGEKPRSLQQLQQELRNNYLRAGYKLQGGGGTGGAPKSDGGGATPPSTGGGGGGEGGGSVVSPSMAGLQDAASMSSGGGDGGGAGTMGAGSLLGPSRFRQGIGTRILPQMSASLAALKQVY